MVIEFLEKYQEELIAEKIDLKEEMDVLTSKIKENEKFADVLDSTNDSYFNNFTPRDVNKKDKEKVVEVKEYLSQLRQDKTVLDGKMDFYNERLEELQRILSQLKKDYSVNHQTEQDKKADVKKQLENVMGYIISDPMRAKIAIEDILHKM